MRRLGASARIRLVPKIGGVSSIGTRMMNKAQVFISAAAVGFVLTISSCVKSTSDDSIHSYVSTDNTQTFITDGIRYHFGPYLLANASDVLKEGSRLRIQDGCYHLGLVVFARFSASKMRCGTYEIRRLNAVQGPIRAYEVNCLSNSLCPAQTWTSPAGRYYLDDSGTLLGFELLSGSPDRLTYLRTSNSGLKITESR